MKLFAALKRGSPFRSDEQRGIWMSAEIFGAGLKMVIGNREVTVLWGS